MPSDQDLKRRLLRSLEDRGTSSSRLDEAVRRGRGIAEFDPGSLVSWLRSGSWPR